MLFDAEADRARALVEAIATALADPDQVSLADGWAGLALVHGYRAKAGAEGAQDLAGEALEHALGGITAVPWLFTGYAGIGFALQHLDADAGEALEELDGLVARALAVASAWDLTDGAIGLGVYALERGDRALVDRVVERLATLVEPDGAWRLFDSADDDDAAGYHDLGIAHGVAGAVAFLAEAIAAPGARALLAGAVAWLRARERATTPSLPMTEGRRVLEHTGIVDGWCHGDVSTALAFVRAGQAADEPAWIAAGQALALRAARRTDAELAGFSIEGGLCHGAIGRAHIFHRLGLALGDDELLAAARHAYLQTERVAGDGLQFGNAGVALGLLASYTAIEPAWDRVFLLR